MCVYVSMQMYFPGAIPKNGAPPTRTLGAQSQTPQDAPSPKDTEPPRPRGRPCTRSATYITNNQFVLSTGPRTITCYQSQQVSIQLCAVSRTTPRQNA